MEVALGFLPASERDLASCWGALQNELFDAITQPRDSGVAQVKLAWWGEALVRGSAQSAAHPLVRALFAHDIATRVPAAEWQALVHAALQLGAEESSPADLAAALRVRGDYAAAVARIDDALSARHPDQAIHSDPASIATAAARTADAARAIAVGLLLKQLRAALHGRSARHPFVPLQLFARHGLRASDFDPLHPDDAGRALLADISQALAAQLPVTPANAAARRCRVALDRRLLQQLHARPTAASATLSRWSALWTAWRAARAAPARHG